MPEILGKSDSTINRISQALREYEKEHPEARITLYRHNPVAVRIRIIDPSFEGLSKAERSRYVWNYLQELPENAQSDITILLLLTSGERKSSFANQDFEHPLPSTL